MALAKCRECGARVSTEATICPHCGCPAPVAAAASERSSPTPLPAPESQAGAAPPLPAAEQLTVHTRVRAVDYPGILAAVVAMLLFAPLAGLVLVPVIGLVWGRDYSRWRTWAQWVVPIVCFFVMTSFISGDVEGASSGPSFLLWTLGLWLYGGTILWMLPAQPGRSDSRVYWAAGLWVFASLAAAAGIVLKVLPSLPAR